MVTAANKGKSISALVAGLPERYTASERMNNFPTERTQVLLAQWQGELPGMQLACGLEHAITQVDTTDGIRVTLANGEIVHLRLLG